MLHRLQGAGLLGLYASILFKEAGYNEIFCSDIHHDRLDMAAKFGAIPIKLGEVIMLGFVTVLKEQQWSFNFFFFQVARKSML